MNNLKLIPKEEKKDEFIRINRTKKKINGFVECLNYRDKDTRQIIIYLPSFQLTGYGETKEKAFEMLKFSLDDYFSYLIDLPTKKLEAELVNLGWIHNLNKNKEYSKVFVDVKGELKNYNAVGDAVEVEILAV
ncbi:MAG: hypothetical protein NTU43_08795 [Bacteroidetes bacterium]|nr:hypothetical protein [Bacteroidota bacterium]